MSAASDAAARVDVTRNAAGDLRVGLSGRFTLSEGPPPAAAVIEELERQPPARVVFESGGLEGWDSALVSFVFGVAAAAAERGVALDTSGLPAGARRLLELSLAVKPRTLPEPPPVDDALTARVGEVALKAWGTGHPGGSGTIHAGSALGALRRLEQLIQEAVVTVPRSLIAETINIIAVLAGRGAQRRLAELAIVGGLDPATGDYHVVPSKANPISRGDRS